MNECILAYACWWSNLCGGRDDEAGLMIDGLAFCGRRSPYIYPFSGMRSMSRCDCERWSVTQLFSRSWRCGR